MNATESVQNIRVPALTGTCRLPHWYCVQVPREAYPRYSGDDAQGAFLALMRIGAGRKGSVTAEHFAIGGGGSCPRESESIEGAAIIETARQDKLRQVGALG
jgi:hypothetical protein